MISPLVSAFGHEPVRQRMELGDARVLLTVDGAVAYLAARVPSPSTG